MKFQVELEDLGKVVDPRTPFEKAETLKAQGNAYIKSKENANAIKSYTEAYNLIVNDPSLKSQELKLSLISNLAQATLNIS